MKRCCEICGTGQAVKVSTLVLGEENHPKEYFWDLCPDCLEDMRKRTGRVMVKAG